MLLQLIPLHSEQPSEQGRPCLRHEHLLVSQWDLQLHFTILSNLSGAAGILVLIGTNLSSVLHQPHSVAFN